MRYETQGEAATRGFSWGEAIRFAVLTVLFIAALALRAHDIRLLPLEFHPVRQYRSALIARAIYYRSLKSVPEWKKQAAFASAQLMGTLEPPLLEHLASFSYRLVGKERLWIPRFMSCIFWLIGGVFLYLLSREIVSPNAAVFSTAFYLFLPYGVIASRSFQPDPMMVVAMVISAYAIFLYHAQPSNRRLAFAILASALAMLIKPLCLFLIMGAFICLSLPREGVWATLKDRRSWFFAVLSLLPTTAYYSYGILTGGRLESQAKGSFQPHLFLQSTYWLGWAKNIDTVVGAVAVIVALLGALMFREGLPRALGVGLWLGYAAFGLVFNYHIHTHDYYQLQFIPVVALSLGPVAEAVSKQLANAVGTRWVWRSALASILLLAGAFGTVTYLRTIWEPLYWVDRDQVTISQTIGQRINHNTKTVFLSYAYGELLEYHGELFGTPWPWRSDIQSEQAHGLPAITVEQRFKALHDESSPEYFIITEMAEYERQPELQAFLTKNFALLAQGDRWLIFDLRKKPPLSP